MREFFAYESPYRTNQFLELNRWEWGLPIIILMILIWLLIKYKDIFKSDRLDTRLRISIAIIFTVLYASHYILRYSIYGFDFIILPFQLCSISMFFAIILLLTKNKTIYSFVLFTGVAGGVISLITPVLGYNSGYYRYYQFMIAHILLVLTPLYFLVVHEYIPTKRATINSFLIFQGILVFMSIFNYIYGTDFMFIFFDQAKLAKFPVIERFGGIPYYIIWGQLAIGAYFVLGYYGILAFGKKQELIPQT